jgi:peptidoglycan hydrolase-like protein with peptidoglycan-binding domain
MSKRFIISEEEKNDIRSKYGLVNEQDENTFKAIKSVQCFLTKKGYKVKVTGDMDNITKKSIEDFQNKAKLYPANGNWSDTVDKLNPKDVELFKQCMSDEGDFIDKGIHFLGLD